MNPPLRKEEDRLAIIKGLADGTIDLIATDHAPHSREEKERSITAAPSGIIGLETSLALGITSLVRPGHLTLMQLLEKMTVNPAICITFPQAESRRELLPIWWSSIRKNTGFRCSMHPSPLTHPFTGWDLYGKVKMTVCNGNIVYSGLVFILSYVQPAAGSRIRDRRFFVPAQYSGIGRY